MNRELAKNYDPAAFEDRIYEKWTESGCFSAVADPDKKPYTIVIPPPNVTGQLHMGHALDETYQDILIRYKRMSGYAALWVPGTDHAALATEVKLVEALAKEGVTKEQLGREGFLKRAWEWKEHYAGRIIGQLKKLGSSCDWDRLRFTMDENCSAAVREFFVRLYNKGLIYRGERMINWCVNCKTSLSDAEVTHEEKGGNFWHILYKIKDSDGFVEIATTRPETLLADTAVAVNPADPRYSSIIGKTVILPLVGREIPVIADDYVKTDFGTGVVKITPAHDPNDFEVGKRHNLPSPSMMTDDGKISADYPAYAGMDRYAARKKIVEDLNALGQLVKTEEHSHNVGTCSRCGHVVEPKISTQWFVKMEQLAKPAIDAVKTGETKFVPEHFEKVYFHWLENINDWCISRQIWWGHRIPAFYCPDCGEMYVSKDDSVTCPKCGKPCVQDEDTLDTWFSSALWPFSTLGWNGQAAGENPGGLSDFDYFYPTDTLVTGYDIILFWVMRMMFSGLECTGKAPFKTVLIHGLVRDNIGRKMSKSLGNGVDPLDIIAEYGADALRFMLVSGNAPGNDLSFDISKVKAASLFANKLWNASRFVMMNLPDDFTEQFPDLSQLEAEDKWILTKLNRLRLETAENLDKFELGVAAANIEDFIRDVYCDWYIELAKPRLSGDSADKARQVLVYVLRDILKLLHPFMPFITEEISSGLDDSILMVSSFPVFDERLVFERDERNFAKIIDGIKAVRNRRTEMNVPPAVKAPIYIETAETALFAAADKFFIKMAFASSVEIAEKCAIENALTAVTADARFFIPLDSIVNKDEEIARLTKEKAKVQKDIDFSSGKLNNAGFVSKAPAAQIEAERTKLAAALDKMKKIEESLKAFS
ncbi:MAG: valine--tRNA ligase [Ruminococcus sp.]|nr:valine--tRNA ligase [Ruminococcus sp.]